MMGWIYTGFGLGGALILAAMAGSRKFFRTLLLSALQGIAAFFAVNFIGSFFGISLPLNIPSLALSALGGIPGVVLLLLMQALCAAI